MKWIYSWLILCLFKILTVAASTHFLRTSSEQNSHSHSQGPHSDSSSLWYTTQSRVLSSSSSSSSHSTNTSSSSLKFAVYTNSSHLLPFLCVTHSLLGDDTKHCKNTSTIHLNVHNSPAVKTHTASFPPEWKVPLLFAAIADDARDDSRACAIEQ